MNNQTIRPPPEHPGDKDNNKVYDFGLIACLRACYLKRKNNMSAKKSLISVKKAVELSFMKMNKRFSTYQLCGQVKQLTGRDFLMDGTILRRLRELRIENPEKFNYIVEDADRSIYKKVEHKREVEKATAINY